ncbi:uncharacterized protein AMSG_08520 [Thecamonas trahens ATCC 50062]|uniref:Transcription factor CBF/NF-Y/archaeal histone domain-containing protein n=1 Tax=Thecamonas trahens ATCC 50062 TaxID=461836 RepID=A0A0L0DKT4_THETB|nr:hypothetical protein AMSG_08520 [Thecamonas trahens ATCC 50062]KNC52651.1 hypothetical protein AMSG_08520 [Thecamonas trahens ATCC 50062]|eukprot:XP_013755202.1 hypothetical protein AMSG_08520 [Thecamonas trahens ATCC 50062]
MSDLLELPRSQVYRHVRQFVPNGTLLTNDVKLAFQKSSAVFILFITEAAQHLAATSGRTSITDTDVLRALEECEFEQFVEPLTVDLALYNKLRERKLAARNANRAAQIVADMESSAVNSTATSTANSEVNSGVSSPAAAQAGANGDGDDDDDAAPVAMETSEAVPQES